MRLVREFLRGAGAPLRAALLLLRSRELRRLAIRPMLVNLALLVVGVPLAVAGGVSMVDWLLADSAVPLRTLVELLVAIVIVALSLVLFVALATALAAPFLDRLSRGVERQVTGIVRDDVGGGNWGVADAFGRLLLFVLCYPPILATGLIPAAGAFLQPVLTMLYGALVLSLDFSEPTLSRRIRGLRGRLGYLRRRPGRTLGFGLVALAASLVPLVNLVVLPLLTTAATLLVIEEEEGRRAGESVY